MGWYFVVGPFIGSFTHGTVTALEGGVIPSRF